MTELPSESRQRSERQWQKGLHPKKEQPNLNSSLIRYYNMCNRSAGLFKKNVVWEESPDIASENNLSSKQTSRGWYVRTQNVRRTYAV